MADKDKIRLLNDTFRQNLPRGGRLMMTCGVNERGPYFALMAVRHVREFSAFNADNDPHGEHDFGSFEIDGEKLFFKIDYYDKSLQAGSEDPADPEKTTRVLTIMFASEY